MRYVEKAGLVKRLSTKKSNDWLSLLDNLISLLVKAFFDRLERAIAQMVERSLAWIAVRLLRVARRMADSLEKLVRAKAEQLQIWR
jgi:hypothetical protein